MGDACNPTGADAVHAADLCWFHCTVRQPGGAYSFVLFSTALGLSWGYQAWKTKSIGQAVLVLVVHDALGLGGTAYAQWLGQ